MNGPERDGDRDEDDVRDQFDDPPIHGDAPLLTVGQRQRQDGVGQNEGADAGGETTTEPTTGVHVVDRSRDPGEEIRMLDDGCARRGEGIDEAGLDRGPDLAHVTGIPNSSLRRSMARRMWVLTELGDTPSVAAMASVDRSSKYRNVMQSR